MLSTARLQPPNMDEIAVELGRRIAGARVAAGLKQSEVASRIGVAESSLQNWERGRNTPSAIALVRLANCLGVTPNDLCGQESLLGSLQAGLVLVDDAKVARILGSREPREIAREFDTGETPPPILSWNVVVPSTWRLINQDQARELAAQIDDHILKYAADELRLARKRRHDA